MTIKLIPNKHKKTASDPDQVWANIETDELRKLECLCFNCETMESCDTAKELLGLCRKYNMSLMITKCGAVDEYTRLIFKEKYQ